MQSRKKTQPIAIPSRQGSFPYLTGRGVGDSPSIGWNSCPVSFFYVGSPESEPVPSPLSIRIRDEKQGRSCSPSAEEQFDREITLKT